MFMCVINADGLLIKTIEAESHTMAMSKRINIAFSICYVMSMMMMIIIIMF
jgi:hypothetical protein